MYPSIKFKLIKKAVFVKGWQQRNLLVQCSNAPTMSSSSLSLQSLPDAVIQVHFMMFVGPRFLLPMIGMSSRGFHLLAVSDQVWQEFCSWHMAQKSRNCINNFSNTAKRTLKRFIKTRRTLFEDSMRPLTRLLSPRMLWITTRNCAMETRTGMMRATTLCVHSVLTKDVEKILHIFLSLDSVHCRFVILRNVLESMRVMCRACSAAGVALSFVMNIMIPHPRMQILTSCWGCHHVFACLDC